MTGMKPVSRTILASFAMGLAVLLVGGCTGQPLTWNTSHQVPFDGVILGPNEKVTLTALPTERSNYFCSNGAVLQCERLNLKVYCSCPRAR